MSRILQILFLLAPLLAGANVISIIATPQEEQFNAGNKLFAQNKFADAATAYEELIQTGSASPALYFNLGNAYFKSSQIGRAIATYRMAEEMSPRDPDVRANLRFARNQVQSPTLRPRVWETWLGTLSVNEWAWLSAASLWLTFGLLTLRQLRPATAGAMRSWTWLSGACLLACSLCLGIRFAETKSASVAIVIAPDATLRTSPLEDSPAMFTAHDGAELRVLDRLNDWLQLTDGAGRTGWLQRERVSLGSSDR